MSGHWLKDEAAASQAAPSEKEAAEHSKHASSEKQHSEKQHTEKHQQHHHPSPKKENDPTQIHSSGDHKILFTGEAAIRNERVGTEEVPWNMFRSH
jgi:uncharacterized protein involved in copper resistance